jgi:hypothetical protein
MGSYTNSVTAGKPQSTLDAETLMSSAIANSFSNRNSLSEFLLVNDRLNLYPESKPEFRHGENFPEVIKRGIISNPE